MIFAPGPFISIAWLFTLVITLAPRSDTQPFRKKRSSDYRFWSTAVYAIGLFFSISALAADGINSVVLEKAQKGDVHAQLLVAKQYRDRGKPEDKVEAARWYEKAAKQGNPEAQLLLGSAYIAGVGVKKEEKIGIGWIQRSANSEFPQAQALVGASYLRGLYTLPRNIALAKEWLTKAASNNDPLAEYVLWQEYLSGINFPKNVPLAREMLQKASAHGNGTAQIDLALAHLDGLSGFEKNETEALRLLNAAADQGEPLAMYTLGVLHVKGRMVSQDFVRAYALFTVSVVLSNSTEWKNKSRTMRDSLVSPPLSGKEMEQAKIMAKKIIIDVLKRNKPNPGGA